MSSKKKVASHNKTKYGDKKAGTAAAKAKCCDADKKLDISCDVTESENQKFKEHQEQRNKRRERTTKKHGKKGGKDPYPVRDMTWKDKHCGDLLFDMNQDPEKILNSLKKIEKELNDLKDDLMGQARDISYGVVEDKLLKIAGVMGCEAIGAAIGGVIGFFFGFGVSAAPAAVAGAATGAAICGTAVAIDTVISIPELWTSKTWIEEQISKTKQALEDLNEYQRTIKDIEKIKTGSLPEKKKTEAIAKLKEPLLKKQESAVNHNPCLKSKRCQMTPYNKSKKSVYPYGTAKDKSPMDELFKLDQEDGCCPGQQAHHVIPSAKFDDCSEYTLVKDKVRTVDGQEVIVKKGMGANSAEAKAPTICLEGGNNNGTHGKLHKRTDKNTKKMIKGKYGNAKDGNAKACNNNPSSMSCTIEASAKAMKKEFGCDKECVIKELKAFYDKICKGKPVLLKNRNGEEIVENENNGNEDVT